MTAELQLSECQASADCSSSYHTHTVAQCPPVIISNPCALADSTMANASHGGFAFGVRALLDPKASAYRAVLAVGIAYRYTALEV